MKFCPNCGHVVKDTDNVCSNCGYRLKSTKSNQSNSQPNNQFHQVRQNHPVLNRPAAPQQRRTPNKQVNNKSHKSSGKFFKIFISLCVIALVAEGGYLLYDHFNNKNSQTMQSSNNSQTTATNSNNGQAGNGDKGNSTSNDNNNQGNSGNEGSYWNSEKQAKFDDFFQNWSTEMKQDYTKYSGSGTFEAGPIDYPDGFKHFDVDDQPVSIGMSNDGQGNYDYNVVDIYNHGTGEFHITYFMTFHDGQPVVLVDQTTNGDHVAASVTQNKKLKDGFASIANGD